MSERPRALVFGEVAAQYERARPSYPDAMVADIVAGVPDRRVVEIGAGTGKATRQFAPLVAELVAIEPDAAMAAVLAEVCRPWPHVRIEPAPFEAWPAPPATADLVISGQAWHWVDPAVAIPKVAAVLVRGGMLATFWNRPRYFENPLRAEFDAIYRQMAPEMDDSVTATVGPSDADRVGLRDHVDRLERSGRFASITERIYEWAETRTTAAYVELLGTHSNHLLLPADRRVRLHQALADVIDAAGGTLTIPHRTEVILATVPG